MKTKWLHGVLSAALAAGVASPVFGQRDAAIRFEGRAVPAAIAELKLEAPVTATGITPGVLDRSLVGAVGTNRVIIRLSADSAAIAFAKGADTAQAKEAAKAQQEAFLGSVRALDPKARLIGRAQSVLNAVFVEVDAAARP